MGGVLFIGHHPLECYVNFSAKLPALKCVGDIVSDIHNWSGVGVIFVRNVGGGLPTLDFLFQEFRLKAGPAFFFFLLQHSIQSVLSSLLGVVNAFFFESSGLSVVEEVCEGF
jgi:hypothetical protein